MTEDGTLPLELQGWVHLGVGDFQRLVEETGSPLALFVVSSPVARDACPPSPLVVGVFMVARGADICEWGQGYGSQTQMDLMAPFLAEPRPQKSAVSWAEVLVDRLDLPSDRASGQHP